MLSRCCEFVDSRLRRSPPDRASAVPYGQAGENAMRFPHLAHRSAAAHKLHSTPQQHRMNLISGNDQTSSRLPAFSLFLPESCPNNRDRRSSRSRDRHSRRRLADQYSSRLRTRPVLLSASGLPLSTLARADICSQAASGESDTCRRGNTPESSIDGRTAQGSIPRPMARTLCAERSRHRFTRKPGICEPCSCCLVTRSWRAPCVISGSRLMTRSASRSRSNFSRAQGCGPANSMAATASSDDRARQLVAICPLKVSPWWSRRGRSWVES
jgi:hypothetical protein